MSKKLLGNVQPPYYDDICMNIEHYQNTIIDFCSIAPTHRTFLQNLASLKGTYILSMPGWKQHCQPNCEKEINKEMLFKY